MDEMALLLSHTPVRLLRPVNAPEGMEVMAIMLRYKVVRLLRPVNAPEGMEVIPYPLLKFVKSKDVV
jgi:hypothetical protein